MGRFLDVPFDVFFSILVLTDAESLLAVGQCNHQCREWAGDHLLWKEITRRLQERAVQLPADGFTGIDRMTLEQLKRCAVRACRLMRIWSSEEARPSSSFVVDCSPCRYQHGMFHTTLRIRWIIPITNEFFAIMLGYHMSSGFLQIWRRDANAPRVVINYQRDWISRGSYTDLEEKSWYFIFSEHDPNQFGHTLHVMRFSGFDSNPRLKLDIAVVAKFPTYGSIINVFVLARRALCAVFSGSSSGNVTMFFVPDWLKKNSAHIDTGVEDHYLARSTFVCWMDTRDSQLVMQFERAPRQTVCQHVYSLHDLAQRMVPVPAFPFPLPNPPLLEPVHVFEQRISKPPSDHFPYRELKSLVSFDQHYLPVLPNAFGTREPPTCSRISFASSFGRDLNPTYVFKHEYSGVVGTCPFMRRMVTPVVRRIAFEQDYTDVNTTHRFPVGHSVDLRGHELIALGHACTAWIEARPSINPVASGFDMGDYELKIALFPWGVGEVNGGGITGLCGSTVSDTAMSMCTVRCPPEVDLARATGLWIDAVQGKIFIGLKRGELIVLQFG